MTQPESDPQPKSPDRKLVIFVKEIYAIWISERPTQFAAALAYYAIFSFVPLIYISLTLTEIVISRLSVEEQFYTRISEVISAEAAQALQEAVSSLAERTAGDSTVTTVIGFIALAFTASLAFFQLQHTLNSIWKVPPPSRGEGQTRAYMLNRLLAFAMVLGVALLLIVAAVANVLVSVITSRVEWAAIVPTANFLTTTGLATLALLLIYKVLSNATVRWRQALVGAVIAGILSVVGLYLVKLYLSTGRFTTALEAAGAAAVLLMAFYYLGQIFVIGAVVIRVLAKMSGAELVPREDPEGSDSNPAEESDG
jgi:membrane protein